VGLRNIGLIPGKATIWIVLDAIFRCLVAWFLIGQKLLTLAVVITLLIKWRQMPGAVGTISFVMSMSLLVGTWVFQPRPPKRRRWRKWRK